MFTIVMACQKGGSGKTTLCSHLAVEAGLAGKSVVIIDTDPQGGLADWWNAREAETPVYVAVDKSGLKSTLVQLRKHAVDLVFIDTPGQANQDTADAIRLADLVVIPVQPSPNDLRAVSKTVDAVNHHGKPLLFVINRVTHRVRLTGETAIELSQHGTVAPVKLHNRTDFAASMIDGRTSRELDAQSKSAAEITELLAYITKRLTMEKVGG